VKRIRVHAFGGPEVLALEEAELPQPGPQEVLIRVKAAGVNPYEAYARAGTYGARNPTLPYTPGSDAAGTVEAVGEGIADLAPGDRVFAQGAALFVPYATAHRRIGSPGALGKIVLIP